MRAQAAPTALVLAAVLAAGGTARAGALDLFELERMAAMVACHDDCRAVYPNDAGVCYQTCPAPAPDRVDDWEKNNEPPIDRTDLHLAALEYWDNGSERVLCYDAQGAVLPRAVCDAPECQDPNLCDWDQDGIVVEVDPDDEHANTRCHDNTDCGFSGECSFLTDAGVSACLPRFCGGPCTAFHFLQMAADNNEVIVRVIFDYSPVPPTTLDLWIEYTDRALTLVDSRPHVPQGKQLTIKHEPPKNGMARLRLIVLSTSSLTPIPNHSMIADLVFMRSPNAGISEIRFTTDASQRENSMAPSQGAAQTELRRNELWGSSVVLPATEPGRGDRLVLHYGFDSELNPLTYADVPTGAELCRRVEGEACDTTDLDQRQMLSRLGSLQSGLIAYAGTFGGVFHDAAYFDGLEDHIELPITLSSADMDEIAGRDSDGQSVPPELQHAGVSLSFWLFPEQPDPTTAGSGYPQVLFSHNSQAVPRDTLWGLMLQEPSGEGTDCELSWFEGSVTNPQYTQFVAALPINVWVHIGLMVSYGHATIYVDGSIMADVDLSEPGDMLRCPEIGDNLVLAAFDEPTVLFASRHNNLYGLQTIPAAGGAPRNVLSTGDASFSDPDYSAIADKIVFSSNAGSGNFEIWIADRDGSNRRPLTDGFGDAARGIEARRPRWSWYGDAIVFESNVYDTVTGHNGRIKGYQLYYIGFDPTAGEPRIQLTEHSATATLFSYDDAISRGRLDDYAYWLIPNQLTGDGRSQINMPLGSIIGANAQYHLAHWTREGSLIATCADADFRAQNIVEVALPQLPWSQTATVGQLVRNLEDLGEWDGTEAAQMLAFETLSGRGLLQFIRKTLEPHPDYTVEPQLIAGGVSLSIRYQPTDCSDPDCRPAEIDDLLIEIGDGLELESSMTPLPGKELDVEAKQIFNSRYLVVTLRDPEQVQLIPGTEVAHLVLGGDVPTGLDFEALRSVRAPSLLGVEPKPGSENSWVASRLDTCSVNLQAATAAAFSRESAGGDPARYVFIAGLVDSRPALLRVNLGESCDDIEVVRLDEANERIAGTDWEKWSHYYPCNWFGGYRDELEGRMTHGLRAGIDELRVFNYARSEVAFEIEAASGHAMLDREGRGGVLASNAPTCPGGKHSECPAYHLCEAGSCVLKGCEPNVPGGCTTGTCTLRPESIPEPVGVAKDWVCTVQCSADAECYTEACFNGPCGFCADDMCVECKHTLSDGPFPQPTVVGCPDANSFTCDSGTCVTGCYSYDGGEARFVCDPLLDSCRRGECVPHLWDWTDISPATWAGSGQMQFSSGYYPIAIDTKIAILFRAWGVGDYGRSPEVVVEGRTNTGSWQRLGQVAVHNRSKREAYGWPYRITTSERPSRIRFRLVSSPWAPPLESVSTGVVKGQGTGVGPAQICSPVGGDDCTFVQPGSMVDVGYHVDTGEVELAGACEASDATCIAQLAYLRSGSSTVVILDPTSIQPYGVPPVSVTNTICSYEGQTGPCMQIKQPGCVDMVTLPGQPCPVGNHPYCGAHAARRRLSFPTPTEDTRVQRPGVGLSGGFAVLNCPFYDDDVDENGKPVGLDLTFPDPGPPPGVLTRTMSTGVVVKENLTAGTCTFTASNVRVNGEISYITQPCYQWYGGDGSVDGANRLPYEYHLLDIDRFSTFAGGDPAITGVDYPPPACPPSADPDLDEVCGIADNCPLVSNAAQTDADADGVGDACDDCPDSRDSDGDGTCDVGGDSDNCPGVANEDQADADRDGVGRRLRPVSERPGDRRR